MKKSLVISGGAGLLGLNWALEMRDSWNVHLLLNRRKVKIKGTYSHTVDLFDKVETEALFKTIKPDLVVNAAAITDVDLCQADPKLANSVNIFVTDMLSSLAYQHGAQFVQISTDQLFGGEDSFVPEEATPAPVNNYGLTKWKAEQSAQKRHPTALVLRTNFFGWGPHYRRSFSDWILDGLTSNKVLNMYYDNIFTPIYLGHFVRAAHKLARLQQSGIFNVVGNSRISKYDFSVKLCEKFDLDKSLLKPVRLGDFTQVEKDKAARPLDMSLSNKRLRAILGNYDMSIESMIDALIRDQWKSEILRHCAD